MTRHILRWLLPGVFAYLVFLCATFPARYVWQWLQTDLPTVSLRGIHGSVWAGEARQVVIDSVTLGTLHWQFDWRALLTGTPGYRLGITDGALQVQARIAAGGGQTVRLHDVTGRVPLQRIEPWLPLPAGSADGLLVLDLQSIRFAKGLPQAAEGHIGLRDASLHWPQAAALGSYQMELHTDTRILAHIRDQGGPLALQAKASLTPDGQYQVQGSLSARDPTSAAAKLLAYLGTPDSARSYPFSFTGRL